MQSPVLSAANLKIVLILNVGLRFGYSKNISGIKTRRTGLKPNANRTDRLKHRLYHLIFAKAVKRLNNYFSNMQQARFFRFALFRQ